MSAMVIGKNKAIITDYGMTKTKLGSAQVFVRLLVNGEESQTWYGVFFKKDGTPNEFVLTQLAYCGYDFANHTTELLSMGPIGGCLDTTNEIDVYAKMMTTPTGDVRLRVDTLGEIGPSRLDTNEAAAMFDDSQKAALAAMASKFKPRKKPAPVSAANPDEEMPF
jgi:hypothetical protein